LSELRQQQQSDECLGHDCLSGAVTGRRPRLICTFA
jgi:hypothetical protein